MMLTRWSPGFRSATLVALASVAVAAENGVLAEYFQGNWPNGTPIVSRVEATLNASWGIGSPDPAIPADGFSVRWSTFLIPSVSGTYQLHLIGTDQAWLSVDGKGVTSRLATESVTTTTAKKVTLTAGVRHAVRVILRESDGVSGLTLAWTPPGGTQETIPTTVLSTNSVPTLAVKSAAVTGVAPVVVPLGINDADGQSVTASLPAPGRTKKGTATLADGALTYTANGNLTATDTVRVRLSDGLVTSDVDLPITLSAARGAGNGLWASYFANDALAGSPVLGRIDPGISSDWGTGSPDPVVPSNQFSARWTGWLVPVVTDTYTISTFGDDGFRLYIDDVLVQDRWTNARKILDIAPRVFEAGTRYRIRAEYRENGGNAKATLSWSTPSQRTRVAIPADVLMPSQGPTATDAVLTVRGLETASMVIDTLDADGDAPVFTIVQPPVHGTAHISPDGILSYTATVDGEGDDQMFIQVSDAWQKGTLISIAVERRWSNRAPSLTGPLAVSTPEDTDLTLTLAVDDADGDTVALAQVPGATRGLVAVNHLGQVSYTPPANWSGLDTFTITADDGLGGVTTATVTVTVTPVADPATVVISSAQAEEGVDARLSLTVSRKDPLLGTPSVDNLDLIVPLSWSGDLTALAQPAPTSITIPAGASDTPLSLALADDTERQPTRRAQVTPAGGSPASITILDPRDPLLIHAGSAGYTESGIWTSEPLLPGWEGRPSRTTADGGARATYDFSVFEPGTDLYHAEVFRIADLSSSTAIPYSIASADGAFWTRMDHNPGEAGSPIATGWTDLGIFRFTPGTAQITVGGPPYGLLGRADAIRLTPALLPMTAQTIDRGTVGYVEGGFWSTIAGLGHDGDDARQSIPIGNPWASWASYAPTVPAGRWKVLVWKVADPTNSSALAVDVTTSTGTVGSRLDMTAGPSGWVEVGVFTFRAGDGFTVVYDATGWGRMHVDAIRYESADTPPLPSGGG